MRWNGFLATTIVALLACAAPAAADPFVVDTTTDATGFCSPTSCSIRQAIVSSGETPGPDTIQIPAGDYTLTNGPLQVTTAVTIAGAGALSTTINAATDSRVFQISRTSASISHLTMAGGVATAAAGNFGGNLQASSSTVTLDHVRITGGTAFSGGGVGNRNGTMTITNSLLAYNAANQGGGDGGAIVNFGGDGGAAANLTVRGSTIAYNNATKVGAISQWGNALDTTLLDGVTIGFNTAGSETGGVNPGPGSISLRNSLLAANTAGLGNSNCVTVGITSLGHNVDDGVSCGLGATGDVSGTSAGLTDQLSDYGGETEVLAFNDTSPAFNRGGTCSAVDQTDIGRPLNGACDAGAWEYRINRKVTIQFGPRGPTNSRDASFAFSSDAGTYDCRLFAPSSPDPGYESCDSGEKSYTNLPEGSYRFEVVPGGTREPGQGASVTFTIDVTAPDTTIVSPAPSPMLGTDPIFTFGSDDPDARYECRLAEQPSSDFGNCQNPEQFYDLVLGHQYTLQVRAVDAAGNPDPTPATRTFTTGEDDGAAPALTITGGPDGPTNGDSPRFIFASDDPDATFTCSVDAAPPTPCGSGITYSGLVPGEHTFRVTAADGFGNTSSAERTFTVAAPPPAQTATPTPVPTATPTPTPTPAPVANKSVAADAEGTVLIKDKSGKFVPLKDGIVPNGSEIDTKKGEVTITTSAGEKATFSEGRFKVSQSGGITTATLSEPLDCARSGKARASAKKPKTRKLWGEGKGKFRTKGQYSAATVRGTKWLVQDTCTTTLTRVAQGVVSVRDDVKKKTVTLRKGKSYVARAKKK